MLRNVRLLALVGVVLVSGTADAAKPQTLDLTITGGKEDVGGAPIVVPITLAGSKRPESVLVQDAKGLTYPAQVAAPGLLAPLGATASGKLAAELHVLVPSLKAGEVLPLQAVFPSPVPTVTKGFAWHTSEAGTTDLDFAGRPVLRYVHLPYDDSTAEKRELSYKVFHHLFDLAGQRPVTKGPGGLYPHHRGIFFGFNKISYDDGKKADTWHCTRGTHQLHEKFLASEVGSLMARQRALIAWHGEDKKVFAREERELTVYHVPLGTMVDFASRLRTTGGPVKLDGDPQHAGVQFRADNEVAARTSKQTIFVRPDGVGEPGVELNWPGNKEQVDLPWKAISFVLGDHRFTVANADRPENPKPARFSERTYGRFGSYFVHELTPDKPLEVRYRFWLQDGQMTPAEVARLATGFTAHPRVVLK
jgi:hypothetical protein